MTGKVLERLMPGAGSLALFEEHEARYQLAGQFVAGKRVIDIACGCGMGTAYLFRSGAQSCRGFDVSHEAVEFASSHYPGPRFALGDALNLPLENESVDVVVSFETIEHLTDPARFIEECFRVLVPGGVLIGSTPHDPVYRWVHPEDNPFHLHDFNAAELHSLLLSKGFKDVQLYSQFPVVYPYCIAKQVIARGLKFFGLLDPVMRMLGKVEPVGVPTETEYRTPMGEPRVQRYKLSWVKQPTLVLAKATKPATT